MDIIYILVGFSISIAVVFLSAFIWSVRNGQYDDTESPSMRMLFEDKPIKKVNHKKL